MAAPTMDQKHFRFLDLPPELQLNIIEFAVVAEEPIQITCPTIEAEESWNTTTNIAARTQPAISRVSKAIRIDALKLYYKLNFFRASFCLSAIRHDLDWDINAPIHELKAWLQSIGPQNQKIVKNLMLYDDSEEFPGPRDPCVKHIEALLKTMGTVVGAKDEEARAYCVSFGGKPRRVWDDFHQCAHWHPRCK